MGTTAEEPKRIKTPEEVRQYFGIVREPELPKIEFRRFGEMFKLWCEEETPGCVATGIAELDEKLHGGLPTKQVTGIVGPTGAGKSELVRYIRNTAARSGVGVVHIDVELGWSEMARRDLSQITDIPSLTLRNLTPVEGTKLKAVDEVRCEQLTQAAEGLHALPMVVGNVPGGTPIDHILEYAVQAINEIRTPNGCLFIVDSAHRIAQGMPGNTDIRTKMTDLTHRLDQFSKDHDIPILATYEHNRGEVGDPPTKDEQLKAIAEFRGEYTLAAIIYLKPDRTRENDEFKTWVGLSVPKAREGRTGKIDSYMVLEGPCWKMAMEKNTNPEMDEIVLATADLLITKKREDGKGGTLRMSDLLRRIDRRHSDIKAAVKNLVDSGDMKRHGEGNTTTYSLS